MTQSSRATIALLIGLHESTARRGNNKILRTNVGRPTLPARHLVLLRHKFLCGYCAIGPPHHRQRGKRLAVAAVSLRRMVAMHRRTLMGAPDRFLRAFDHRLQTADLSRRRRLPIELLGAFAGSNGDSACRAVSGANCSPSARRQRIWQPFLQIHQAHAQF
jgi:hypothetical protein